MVMKKLWGPLISIILLPASYSVQRPAEQVETALPLVDDSIPRQTQEPAEPALIFPDYVEGEGWSVQLVLSNVEPDVAVDVRVEVNDPDGQPVLDLFESDLTLEIPALGSRILRSTGAGAIRRGWIQVETGAATVSGLLTYQHAQSGIEVAVKPVELGPQFAIFVEQSPTIGAGVAVFKPDSAPRLELRIRGEDGNDPLKGRFVPWGDFHQAARTFPEWFAVEGIDPGFLGDFRGLLLLETEDESPFAPLGLRFGKETSSLSSVPAIRTHSDESRETNLVFPDYVDGGGWAVQLVLSNIDPEAATGVRVQVYDPDGQPVLDLFDSDLTLEIPALGSRVLRSAGLGMIRRGWMEVRTDTSTVRGLLTYRNIRTGIEVGVEPARLGKEFALFVEESGTEGAGLALFKLDADSRIELRLRDEEGDDPLDGVYVPWRGFHQAARTLPEWFDVPGVETGFLADFRGLLFLRTEDESEFVPLGLRFGKRTSSLSAVPAIRIPAGGGIDGGLAPPPIVTLSASPTSIDRGQSATLTWSSTSGESAEITPDIGMVPTSGSRKVSPNVTTTYRIMVTGADGQTATASATVTVTVSERVALGALFDVLGGSGWTHSDNWLTDAPLGDWYGVEVDSQGRVIGLRMAEWVDTEDGRREKIGNGLTGVIPPELGSLPHLRVLDLSGNQLTGEIPSELGQLSQLQWLYLDRNQLTGPIPSELGQLSQLLRLDLWENQLSGLIPPELGQLSQLQWLYLSRNQLTGPIPPELGQLSQLQSLDLWGNQLTGAIPLELGQLSQLQSLHLGGNRMTGPIPSSFLQLEQINRFWFPHNAGLCAPGTTDFVVWLEGMELHEGPYCNESDVAVLNAIYRNAGGEEWTNSGGWLRGVVVSDWYGIRTDSLGRVTGLDLSDNGLEGHFPASLYRMAQLTELRVEGNPLSGRLPESLTRLSLQEFRYSDTDLCVPNERSFRAWMNAIPSHEGTGVRCGTPSNRDLLVALYDLTWGPKWAQSENWLTQAPLKNWHGVDVDERGRVIRLSLHSNRLEGEIPAELGSLSSLEILNLSGNRLEGQMPPELGRLSKLWFLNLESNRVEGEIPPELGRLSKLGLLVLRDNELEGRIPAETGRLSNLEILDLSANRLEGEIPSALGKLSNLEVLRLSRNRLEGEIPPELGSISSLKELWLDGNRLATELPAALGSFSNLEVLRLENNDLTGSVPPDLGRMRSLRTLALTNNSRMSGALPTRLTSLSRLEALLAEGTDLCAPSTSRFQNWLDGVWKRRMVNCSGGSLPMAYLTQAVQSRKFPVPLVAGEDALLRVFLTAPDGRSESFPPVRAKFYVRGRERNVLDIPGRSTPVPTLVNEGLLSRSANAEVPGRIVQPGLEMVIEIDPDGTLGMGTGLTKRIPKSGRLAVDVRAMPTFDLTIIPFVWTQTSDSSIVDVANSMAAKPAEHELLWHTRTLLPIKNLDVTAHEAVRSSTNSGFSLLHETEMIQAMEGKDGHYMGMMSWPVTGTAGVAMRPGKASFSVPESRTIAHELGHNLNLAHAPCGGARGPDPSFPETDGSIGAWGYDSHEDSRLVPPSRPDLMTYCSPEWISDYHFANALRYRLHTAAGGGVAYLVAAQARSLLLWGGVGADGAPFLEPAFVVRAPASIPRSTGEYRIIGQTADGDELFSLQFQMPELADGDGRSSFAFVLPVQPEWAGELASITLSGPGGSVTLDQGTDRPVTILRDPRTGQIRAILRGAEAAPPILDATVSALSLDSGLDRLTSRGIPDPEDWMP